MNSTKAMPGLREGVDGDTSEQQGDDLGAPACARDGVDEQRRDRPPRKAKTATPGPPSTLAPIVIAMDAPSAAPEDTPTTPGSASGLPKMACMTAPATASDAPTMRPMTMRGKRTTHSVDSTIGSVGAHALSMPIARSSEPNTSVGVTELPGDSARNDAADQEASE